MIKYALVCEHGHEFDAWFASSDAYDDQAEAGLIACPICDTNKVSKQIMAPAIAGRAADRGPTPDDIAKLAGKIRNHIRDTHDYVGDQFAAEARAMHAGDKDHRPIYGETTKAEAKSLKDEGVPAQPLPAALAPTPPKKLN